MASFADVPHISSWGFRPTHVDGRSGFPNSAQRMSSVRCGQRTPASFPSGSAAHGEIEGAIQQAPHRDLHSTWRPYVNSRLH